MNYEGNGITKYIIDNKLDDYFFSAKNSWLLLYGKKEGQVPEPRLLAFVCEVNDDYGCTAEQKKSFYDAVIVSKELKLPLLAIRFKKNFDVLPRASPWESGHGNDGCAPKGVLRRL